ncbi:hypothetical protein SNE40_013440 [Patella caerulea]|uniref:SMB domain-containing protein n=1 Tax=Patella caerulea TaxID=87958 RepID=A0AAN8JG63_PATCE
MGKIYLFFTFALLLYLIGKTVTDERTVHQHTAYSDSDSVTPLATEVNRDTVTTSVIDGKRDTVASSATDSDRDTVTTSATDSDRETETTPTTDADRDAVTTSSSTTNVYSDTITVSATRVDRETVITAAKDMYLDDARGPSSNISTTEITRDTTVTRFATDTASISDIDVAKNDLDFTTPTLENNDDRLLIRSVESHTDAVTRPAIVKTSTVAQSLNSTSNCSNVVKASCRQKCGMYRSLPCSCDQFCLIYKNCCPDYEMVCVQDAEILREYYSDLLDVDITCLESPTMDTHLGLQVISGCPVQVSGESKGLCNPANIKPVTLYNTNLHFINIQCLICNGFNPSHITQWNLQIVPHAIELDLITGGFEKLIQSGQFSLYPLPKSGIDLTYCCNKVIDHCEVPSTMEDKCSRSHSFYLKYGPARTTCLKNHFCAECNKNLYPDVCQWNEMDFAAMKMIPRMAFSIETGNKDRVSVKSYGTRNQMFWSSAECKSPINGEFGVDITDCTLQECRQNIQLTDGKCLLNNKMFCFVIIANLSLIDQDINIDKLSGLLSQQAILSLSQMNFTLGSFNTTFYKRTQLLYYEWKFTNEATGLKVSQFNNIYLPSLEIRLLKNGISGNISVCTALSSNACSDTNTNQCRVYHNLELSPHHSTNQGSRELISNYVLAIVILMKFMAAIIGL